METRTSHVGEDHRRKPRHRAVPLVPEIRFRSVEGIELRDGDKSGNIVQVVGEPIVYDQFYEVRDHLGTFREKMRPGVASDALAAGADVRYLLNHDGLPMARSLAGTLTFEDTPTALRCVASLDIRQRLSNDYVIAVERGDLTQMSCGFCVGLDVWSDDMEEREIFRFSDFSDVSGVTYPASPSTSVQLAQRTALTMPVESRARVRKLYVDLRAGKVLSQGNQDRIVDAVSTLHSVLAASGLDPASLIDDESDDGSEGSATTDDATEDTQDGSERADTEQIEERAQEPDSDAQEPVSDASDAVVADPPPVVTPISSSRARLLRLELEARKRRRPAA